jgi:preprotein translocase subunit SecD
LYAAPVVQSEITDGKAQITGNFTEEEAQALVAKINEAIQDQ